MSPYTLSPPPCIHRWRQVQGAAHRGLWPSRGMCCTLFCFTAAQAPASAVSVVVTWALFVGVILMPAATVNECVCSRRERQKPCFPVCISPLRHDRPWNPTAVANTDCLPGHLVGKKNNKSVQHWSKSEQRMRGSLGVFLFCEADDRGLCHAVFSSLWYRRETGSQPLWRSVPGNDKHPLDLVNLHNKWFLELETWPVPHERKSLWNTDRSHKQDRVKVPMRSSSLEYKGLHKHKVLHVIEHYKNSREAGSRKKQQHECSLHWRNVLLPWKEKKIKQKKSHFAQYLL